MTAKRIAGKFGLTVAKTQELLRDHISKAWQENTNPKIRYSNLPSKRTLQVLWGAVSNVGMRPLMPLTRTGETDESLADIELWDSANIFFSHSHRDYDKVIYIAKSLTNSGFSPWLAETHIDWGADINAEIVPALSNADAFLLYLSANGLNSRWTNKEYEFAVQNLRIPIFIVADNDDSILKLVCKLADNKEANGDSDELEGTSRDFYESLQKHRNDAKYFQLEKFDSTQEPLPIDTIVHPIKEQNPQLGEVLPKPN